MPKIVNIREYRKTKTIVGQMNYDDTDEIKGRFEVLAGIIDELFLNAEKYIKECGLNPSIFTLRETCMDDCMLINLKEFFSGGEEAISLLYEAVIDGIHYAAVSDAAVDGEEVSFDVTLVKWDGNEWLAYTGDGWTHGPGADFI